MRLLKQQILLPEYSPLSSLSLAYMSLVRPILEYGTSWWDPYRDGQINASERVQKKAVLFAKYTNNLVWETLTAYEDSSHLRPFHSILRRTGMEIYREQVKRNMLPEQG
jgi:hypothetical protein